MEFTGVFVAAIFALGALVLMISAIASVANSRSYTPGLKALWVLAILAFPILGSLVWFVVGRHSHG